MVDAGDENDTVVISAASEILPAEAVLTASISELLLRALFRLESVMTPPKFKWCHQCFAQAGVGDDLMSITGGTTMALFGGVGNDSFNFVGGRVSAVLDTGAGADSVLLSDTLNDTVTLTVH